MHENLEQAIDSITTTLTKCDFYHRIYDAFVVHMTGAALIRHPVFDTFNATLPELYADVFEVTIKAKVYFHSPNHLGRFCREL